MKTIDFRHDLLPLKDKIFRLAQRIVISAAEAEDITQDILIRMWEKRAELAATQSLEAYVLTATHHLALDRLQRRAADTLSLDTLSAGNAAPGSSPVDPADSAPRPDERLERSEQRARVRQLIDRLPTPQRTALQLRDIEGKTYREVADIMGITEDNVKVVLFRARQALKQQYLRDNPR
jgi:RNA polymerase sigma-70 factor (ECF subfamily)